MNERYGFTIRDEDDEVVNDPGATGDAGYGPGFPVWDDTCFNKSTTTAIPAGSMVIKDTANFLVADTRMPVALAALAGDQRVHGFAAELIPAATAAQAAALDWPRGKVRRRGRMDFARVANGTAIGVDLIATTTPGVAGTAGSGRGDASLLTAPVGNVAVVDINCL